MPLCCAHMLLVFHQPVVYTYIHTYIHVHTHSPLDASADGCVEGWRTLLWDKHRPLLPLAAALYIDVCVTSST